MAVAFVALLLALGGTAGAKFGPFKGDKIIKKHSLSGNRLKNNTISGKQINLGTLGTVPTANTANNANSLGGFPPGAYAGANRVVSSNGLVKVPATGGTGTNATVLKYGPFTITGNCLDNGGGSFSAQLTLTSSEPNSVLDDVLHAAANDPEVLETTSSTTLSVSDDQISAQAPSGASLNLQRIQGVHGIGDCFFEVGGVH